MKTKGYIVNGNDLFVPLYTFWKTQQSECDLLIQKIREKMPVTKDTFHQLRNSISSTTDNYDKASSYFIINRTSFSGATLCGGFSMQASEKRLTESSIQRLKSCDTSNITFTNLDCNVFLTNNPQTAETVIYADPPYYINTYIHFNLVIYISFCNHSLYIILHFFTFLGRNWLLNLNASEESTRCSQEKEEEEVVVDLSKPRST